MGETYLSDNSGNRVPPDPNLVNPVAASGITKATGTAGDDLTSTVVAGAMYAVTGVDTGVLLSITGATSTPANIEWVAPINTTIIVQIPVGKTTLYYEGTASTKNVYIRRVAD